MESSSELCVIHCTTASEEFPLPLTAVQLKTVLDRAVKYVELDVSPLADISKWFIKHYNTLQEDANNQSRHSNHHHHFENPLMAHQACYVKFSHSRNLKVRKRAADDGCTSLSMEIDTDKNSSQERVRYYDEFTSGSEQNNKRSRLTKDYFESEDTFDWSSLTQTDNTQHTSEMKNDISDGWTDGAVRTLCQLHKDTLNEHRSYSGNSHLRLHWNNIREKMNSMGYTGPSFRTYHQISGKWRYIISRYKMIKNHNDDPENKKMRPFKHFDVISEIFGDFDLNSLNGLGVDESTLDTSGADKSKFDISHLSELHNDVYAPSNQQSQGTAAQIVILESDDNEATESTAKSSAHNAANHTHHASSAVSRPYKASHHENNSQNGSMRAHDHSHTISYSESLTRLTESHQSMITQLTQNHNKLILDLTKSHQSYIQELMRSHETLIRDMTDKYENSCLKLHRQSQQLKSEPRQG